MADSDQSASERILVLAPTPGDAELCRRHLSAAELRVEVLETEAALCEALNTLAGVLVVADEALQGPAGACIREALIRQEEWSTLPLIVLTGALPRASLRILEDYEVYGRVTLLERPVRMATFVSAVRMALSERRQQYRVRNLLMERAERLRQRDEFLAMLGHELRNPLAAIMTCSDLLEMVDADGDHAQRCHEVIRSQAGQIKRLLDDLVDVSRITRRKLSLQREPLDLTRILDEAITQVEGEIAQRGQRLEMRAGPAGIVLFADPARLQQVFANLLHNASRYSPDGGRIVLSVARDNGLAVVRIRDEGAGMTKETLTKIFEPFFQVGELGSGSRCGLGVGLTLARSLVEMHAGTITASSAGPGQGSELVVSLPSLDAAGYADERREEPTQGGFAPTPRRILLIEDNRDFGQGLKTLLEDRGHEVHLAYDGPEGIRAAERHRPDVVVLDIGLPGLDGYEVAKRLRQLAGLSGVRLIAVTGYGREEDQRRSRLAGIDRHLLKPVRMPDLEAAIANT